MIDPLGPMQGDPGRAESCALSGHVTGSVPRNKRIRMHVYLGAHVVSMSPTRVLVVS